MWIAGDGKEVVGVEKKIDQWTVNGVWNDLTACLFSFVGCEI